MYSFMKQKYMTRLKLRLTVSVLLLALGVTALSLGLGMISAPNSSAFISGFYTGTGSGLIGASIVTAIRVILLLRDPERRRKEELKENDERNIFLLQRATYLAFWIVVFSLYGGLLVAGLFSELVVVTLMYVLAATLLIWLIVYSVLRRIY